MGHDSEKRKGKALRRWYLKEKTSPETEQKRLRQRKG